MNKILITGATGNVGLATLKALQKLGTQQIVAGVREIKKDQKLLDGYHAALVHFDFTNLDTFDKALEGCKTLFLLRPPHLSAVKKYFQPLIASAKKMD